MTKDYHRITPYPLRLEAELRKQLDKASKKESRSLHAEIVHRLTASFDAPDNNNSELAELIRQIIKEELPLFLSPETPKAIKK